MTDDSRINDDMGAEIVPEYDPASEQDTAAKQNQPRSSEALNDPDVDPGDVQVLPGTGGPDDVGEIDVDKDELNMSGDSIPGHPKPDAGR